MLAPVLLFTYSRAKHTEETIIALSKNELATETEVFAYTCSPNNDKVAPYVEETKEVLKKYSNSPLFKSFNIVDRNEYVPLGPAMADAVTQVLEKYGRVIVVEDDIVTSTDFLNFMNDALDFYENSKKIFSISGYSFGMESIKNLEDTAYMIRRNNPWGWGTWKDRWDNYDILSKDYLNSTFDRKARNKLRLWSEDLPMLMDELFLKEGCLSKNWEQQMRYRQCVLDMYTICPKISKVKNIGFTGIRTNESPIGLKEYYEPDGSPYSLRDFILDEKFQKEYNKKFIFGIRHKFMLLMSNIAYWLSPRLYYRLLKMYYKSDVGIDQL